MIGNNPYIFDLTFGNIVKELSESKGITVAEARKLITEMSFIEYKQLIEANLVPPSGNTIGPSANPGTQKSSQAAKAPTKMKAIWPGQGAPLERGMTVGSKDQSGKPVPAEVSQVDNNANGVKVKNPVTGKEEWMNINSLEPYMSNEKPVQEEIDDLFRMRQLAGIVENASSGATSAGAIAVAPTTMGLVKRRQPAHEELKKEYTPKGPAKTIVGDTKPNQASGQLSANLAASGIKTASRSNNGRKRK